MAEEKIGKMTLKQEELPLSNLSNTRSSGIAMLAERDNGS
jgi:hypothetical protein